MTLEASAAYRIYIGQNIVTRMVLEQATASKQRWVMITDTQVFEVLGKTLQKQLQDQGLPLEVLTFPAGEQYKTRETKQMLEDELLRRHYGRDTCILALGGGVVSDLVGFLAATYCRGVSVIYLPTTLLAMVDASIGGKTGVNTPFGKNLIGSFTQPQAVIMDTRFLDSLPQDEWHNGRVEMIKHAAIADLALFARLEENIPSQDDALIDMIYQSCEIKKNIVEQDEHEQGLRQLLNFGHTIGHAIETLEQYALSHGEAVAIGMLMEAYLAVQMGYLQLEAVSRLENILSANGLSLQTKAFANRAKFLAALSLDKKSIKSEPRFVLLDHLGQPHCEGQSHSFPVPAEHLNHALDWAEDRFVDGG